MKNKRILSAVIATAALALGLTTLVAGPTQAHSLQVQGKVACQTDGTASVTWTGTTTNVPDNDKLGTWSVKSSTPPGSNLDSSTGTVNGNSSFTVTQSNIPGDFKGNININFDIAWPNFTQHDVTGHIKLDTTCVKPDAADANIAVSVTAPTCVSGVPVPGSATWGATQNVVTPLPALDQNPGAHTSPTVSATPGHVFSNGLKTGTTDYTIPKALTGLDCNKGETCTVTGSPYTEDGYPTFTADGQRYGNPDASVPAPGHALNWLVPTSGNLQGFTNASYTISGANGYQAGYRFVLYSNGTSGYTSVTAEPYMNGWVAGQTGTFTITPDTLVWNSHIANGPGSQSQPISITAMAALIPANQFISQGIHSGSTFVAGQYTTVSKITGCITYDKPVKPAVAYSHTVVTSDTDCLAVGGGSYTTTITYYTDEPTFVNGAWVNATPRGQVTDSAAHVGDNPVVTTTKVGTDVCPVHISTPVVFPTQTDLCGTSQDSRQAAVNTDAYTIKTTDNADGSVDYTATANAGYVFDSSVVTTAHLDALTNVACPLNLPPKTVQALATTGVTVYGTLSAAALLLALGATLMVLKRRRKADAQS